MSLGGPHHRPTSLATTPDTRRPALLCHSFDMNLFRGLCKVYHKIATSPVRSHSCCLSRYSPSLAKKPSPTRQPFSIQKDYGIVAAQCNPKAELDDIIQRMPIVAVINASVSVGIETCIRPSHVPNIVQSRRYRPPNADSTQSC